jgi:integrase
LKRNEKTGFFIFAVGIPMAVRKREGKRGTRWLVDYYDSTGKRRYLTFRTWKEAKATEADLRRRKGLSDLISPNRLTLAELAEGISDRRGHKITPRRQVTSNLQCWILPRFGSVQVQKISRYDIKIFLLDIRMQGRGKAVTRGVLGTFRVLMSEAVERGLLLANPCSRLSVPKVDEDHSPDSEDKKFTPLEEGQISVYAEMAQKLYPPPSPFGALLTLAIYTGFRRTEILGLRWGDFDIDCENPKVRVRRNWDPQSKQFTTLKTSSSRREVILFPDVIGQLKTWRLASIRKRPGDQVFPVLRSALASAHKRVLGKAGLPVCRFHDLRVYFASVLARRNVPPKMAQRLMGHSNISMTLDLYARFSREDEAEVIERLKGFGGSGSY